MDSYLIITPIINFKNQQIFMSKFFYNGVLVEVKRAEILEVNDDGSCYELTVLSEKFRYCGHSIYFLPKNKLQRMPEVGEILTSYEVASTVVGCDLNEEIQYREPGLIEVQ